MAHRNENRNLTTWTLALSLAIHAILFSASALTKISAKTTPLKTLQTPAAKIQQLKKTIEQQKLLPKPKVKKPDPSPVLIDTAVAKISQKKIYRHSPQKQFSADLQKLVSKPQPQRLKPATTAKTEFFGSKAFQKNICYVVDCSGSMQGIFYLVKQNLKNSIQKLMPNQYFNIIFFGSNQIYDLGSGSLLRASPDAKKKAFSFINSITPAGNTTPKTALDHAFTLKDPLGTCPELIYFLTDGFEMHENNSNIFMNELEQRRKYLCPKTKLNTIGFWTKPDDCSILSKIAMNSGGTFTHIKKPKTERYIEIE